MVGTWRLISMAHIPQTSPAYFPYGERPQGFLIYTDETMLVTLVSEDRTKSFSYGGRCHVEDARVTHEVAVSTKPDWVGTTQVRDFALPGDEAIFSTATLNPVTGEPERAELRWRRTEV